MIKNVLVPIDFSEQTEGVLAVAAELAESLGAHIWLIHIADPEPDFVGYGPGPEVVRQQVATRLRDEHRDLHALADRLRSQGLEVTALAIQGPTVDRIVSEVEKLSANIVIMGSHGHGALYRTLLGSVSEGVLHRANCPVLIVPPQREQRGATESS
jgi:nucleotide-binding universal stress UspA family protein